MEWSVDILLPFVQLHLYLSFLIKTASEHTNYAIIFLQIIITRAYLQDCKLMYLHLFFLKLCFHVFHFLVIVWCGHLIVCSIVIQLLSE